MRFKARTAIKSPEKTVSAQAAAEAAASHVSRVIEPAERLGLGVRVFSHAWGHSSSAVAKAVDGAYGGRLVASTHEPFAHPHPGVSMVLSMKACLALAAPFLSPESPPPDAIPLKSTGRFASEAPYGTNSTASVDDHRGSSGRRQLRSLRQGRARAQRKGNRFEAGSFDETYEGVDVDLNIGRGKGHVLMGNRAANSGADGPSGRVSRSKGMDGAPYSAPAHAVVVLMRHDCFWFSDFQVAGLQLPLRALVTATW
jgi:hypothetical protein